MEGNGRAVNILHLLKGQDFILQNRTQHTRLIVDRIFHKRHIEPHIEPYIILETSNIQAEAELAARNYGFTFITETHLKYIPNRDQLALFSIGSPKTTVDFVATYRKIPTSLSTPRNTSRWSRSSPDTSHASKTPT